MSSSLSTSGAFAADPAFQQRVSAAIIEHAKVAVQSTDADLVKRTAAVRLGEAVLYDPTSYVRLFSGLCADDATVSAQATVGDVTDDMIRGVVAALWASVYVVVPGLH
ncbi:MAG TPA: hypothetical protein VFV01_47790 [Spirillospora sp.]|nr:hypothetical protein [Spirillospora sp.]